MNRAIVGHSLVSCDGLQVRDRDDILDCLMQADGVASRAFKRGEAFTSWMFRYRNRLEKHGCVSISPIIHTPQVIFDPRELERITFKVVHAAGSQALAQQAAELIDALQVRRRADAFFYSGGMVSELAGFQVVPCTEAPDGQPMLLVCGITLTGSSETRGFDFWSTRRREMLLRISGAAYRFDRDVYDRYREPIAKELSDRGRQQIKFFDL